ncbi:hypothetical protein CFOL_v3_32840 [Cephalotus follicularis]|uniref:Exo_endo_phos domain-containing protein n=1 Tax=Cephalotus follicularis TaxID=3775 RepID=A0A1Q3DAG3_CEPFO|nr:hypothetical protein CFOL_v3_32840 [Cephalotus follicularis]
MEEFNCVIRSAELEDLKSTGLKFTWDNMRSGTAAISKKLDRALGNWEWFKVFGESYADTYNQGISDHAPISIQSMQQTLLGDNKLKAGAREGPTGTRWKTRGC